jgi:hypothetical protein
VFQVLGGHSVSKYLPGAAARSLGFARWPRPDRSRLVRLLAVPVTVALAAARAPGDAAQPPENALTGQLWKVNCCSYADSVSAADAKLRLWRNTAVASLSPGQTYTMPPETLGYEWDSDADNGFRPAGETDLSQTCESNVQQVLYTVTEEFVTGNACNSLTLYRAASGARVFSAQNTFGTPMSSPYSWSFTTAGSTYNATNYWVDVVFTEP